ncbi:MAG: Fmu (Sun) domain protein [Chitinophagaceae bacterium]|nr:Fmu (Sun) domain protein [Chitinophagaceae bacterium]
MQYVHQYLRSAEAICGLYDGAQPLASFLKQYFQQNKKYGSKDRRHIGHLCYVYYRLGKALRDLPFRERVKLALFLCETDPGNWKELFSEEWLANWSGDMPHRISFATAFYPSFSVDAVFPWRDQLSAGLDAARFSVSHFSQPDLFLRVRPGYEASVPGKLKAAGIAFSTAGPNCIALPNGTKLDAVLSQDKEVVVQDLNSQRTGELLGVVQSKRPITIWDACAASGGKSILAKDLLGDIVLTVSDLRPSIMHNLQKRFERAGMKAQYALVTDLSKQDTPRPKGSFDLVICDAPCSGSGTWARTPEQLYFFEPSRIADYAALQRAILHNTAAQVSAGGYLLYLTCSVFAEENEMQVEKLLPLGFELIELRSFTGYDKRADSLFGALFRKL